jgi:LytR cell envelope-related transcriptional attenuator
MTPEDWQPGDEPDRDHGYFDDLDDEEWTEEDERRYQARRQRERARAQRRRRQGLAFGTIVLLVLAVGVTAAGVWQGWWSWPPGQDEPATQAQVCPAPTPTAAAPAEVTVTVLNSTDRAGLATAAAAELSKRGFVIGAVGNDPAEAVTPEAAQVRHGPEGLMAARTVAAQIQGAALVDDGRPGPEVEVSLGAAFTGMATPEEAAAKTAPVAPSPAGCVPASPTPTETPSGATAPATTG